MTPSELQKELEQIKTLLLSKKNVLNINELSDYTGYSKSYIYKLTSRNAIPYFKPSGKAVFFDRMEIDVWLLKNKHLQVKESGELIGNEWQKDIPDYWANVEPIKWLEDDE
ncbi:helix-turn-helix domain-containing protein [Flavobacteriaceae bacterium]|nr:helix-turn-helix domain-containing protein [Flavobacteriaceae bacterium]